MNLRIKEICREKGMLMKYLASELGITEVGLSKSLNGDPSMKRLEDIARVLEVSFTELFEEPKSVITCPKCGAKLEVKVKE